MTFCTLGTIMYFFWSTLFSCLIERTFKHSQFWVNFDVFNVVIFSVQLWAGGSHLLFSARAESASSLKAIPTQKSGPDLKNQNLMKLASGFLVANVANAQQERNYWEAREFKRRKNIVSWVKRGSYESLEMKMLLRQRRLNLV